MKKVSGFFGKIKTWTESHKTLVALIITALFVAVHVPLVISHEITSDEAVVWGLSKEINPGNIYEINSVEPHPLLWEIILAPFSQSGAPVTMIGFISLFFVALAVFLFVRFAPFGLFAKLIFLLSSSFFYFNPVIARDYALIPLAICLVCLAYKNRHEKPLLYGLSLAFLAQTHFLMYGLFAILVASFIIESTMQKKSFGKMLLSILLVLVPAGLSVLSTVPEVIGSFENHAIIADKISEEALYSTDFYRNALGSYFGLFVEIMRWIVGAYCAILLLAVLSENFKIGLYLLAGAGFWFFVMNNIYQNYYILDQKVAIFSLILLSIAWLLYLEKSEGKKKENPLRKLLGHLEMVKYLRLKSKKPAAFLIVFLVALTIPRAFVSAKTDLDKPYSSSKEIAAFVNENVEEGALVIEGDVTSSYTFLPSTYLQIEKDIVFYNYPLDSFDDYHIKLRYDGVDQEGYANAHIATNEDLAALFELAESRYEHIYYIGVLGSTCKGDKVMYNQLLLDNYEEVGTLNEGDYIEGVKSTVKVYKIK